MAVEPRPIDPFGVRAVQVGTVVFAVACLGLLPFWGRLQTDGHLWWVWTCLVGTGLGLIGIDICRRRRDAATDDPDRPE
jgi:hypothetical protein